MGKIRKTKNEQIDIIQDDEISLDDLPSTNDPPSPTKKSISPIKEAATPSASSRGSTPSGGAFVRDDNDDMPDFDQVIFNTILYSVFNSSQTGLCHQIQHQR